VPANTLHPCVSIFWRVDRAAPTPGAARSPRSPTPCGFWPAAESIAPAGGGSALWA